MKLMSVDLSENPGPVARFEIEIYNAEDQFYASQTISGALNIEINKDLDCDLTIAVLGKLIVIFAPTVRKDVCILNCRPDTEAIPEKNLLAGHHHFEFTIGLPDTMVSSVISPWVQVKYSANARLIDPRTSALLAEASQPITIFDHHNLNLDPFNKLQVTASFDGRLVPFWLSCLPCLLRSVPSMRCYLPCRAFTPFSFIPIYLSVIKEGPNMLQVNRIKIQLVQVLTWQRLRHSFLITETNVQGSELVDESDTLTLEHGLGVPLLPPSGHYEEYSLKIDYKICLSVHLHNKRRALHLTLPVKIGTVPLAQNVGIDVPY